MRFAVGLACGLVLVACGGSDGPRSAGRAQAAAAAPGIELTVTADSVGGFNVHVDPSRFEFDPVRVHGADRDGAGHAHLFADGEESARMYGEWHHVDGLAPGTHEFTAWLSSNGHEQVTRGGKAVEDAATARASRSGGVPTSRPIVTDAMRLRFTPHEDFYTGFNLHLRPVGFDFAPEDVGEEHAGGRGYARVWVDGRDRGRIYGAWHHLLVDEPGMHEVRVALYSTDHRPFERDGRPVEATATVRAPRLDADGLRIPEPAPGGRRSHVVDLVDGLPAGGPKRWFVHPGDVVSLTVRASGDEPRELQVAMDSDPTPASAGEFRVEQVGRRSFDVRLGDVRLGQLVEVPR